MRRKPVAHRIPSTRHACLYRKEFSGVIAILVLDEDGNQDTLRLEHPLGMRPSEATWASIERWAKLCAMEWHANLLEAGD